MFYHRGPCQPVGEWGNNSSHEASLLPSRSGESLYNLNHASAFADSPQQCETIGYSAEGDQGRQRLSTKARPYGGSGYYEEEHRGSSTQTTVQLPSVTLKYEDNCQSPLHNKRGRSPSNTEIWPNKRPQDYMSNGLLRLAQSTPENTKSTFFDGHLQDHGHSWPPEQHTNQSAPSHGRAYSYEYKLNRSTIKDATKTIFNSSSPPHSMRHGEPSHPIQPSQQPLSTYQRFRKRQNFSGEPQERSAEQDFHQISPSDRATGPSSSEFLQNPRGLYLTPEEMSFKRRQNFASEPHRDRQFGSGQRSFQGASSRRYSSGKDLQLGSPIWNDVKDEDFEDTNPKHDPLSLNFARVRGHAIRSSNGRDADPRRFVQKRTPRSLLAQQPSQAQIFGSAARKTYELIYLDSDDDRDESLMQGFPEREKSGRPDSVGFFKDTKTIGEHSTPDREGPSSRLANQNSPEIVDLVSPPIVNTEKPSIVPVPMKERLPPLKRVCIKNALISRPKPRKATEGEHLTASEKLEEAEKTTDDFRQRRAAQIIIEKEVKQHQEEIETALFGELIGESDDIKERRDEERRAQAKRLREVKAREVLAEMHYAKEKFLKDSAAREAAKEADRIERAKEDERLKAKREVDRKKAAAVEAAITEEHRQRTAERIKAERERESAAAAEREKEKKKAMTAQAEAEELSNLRSNLETAKQQAASLSASKLSTKIDAKSSGERGLSRQPNENEVIDLEDTLFIPEEPHSPRANASTGQLTTTKSKQIMLAWKEEAVSDVDDDDITRTKSMGPNTAAELFATVPPKWIGRGGYQAHRDAWEAKKEDERKKRMEAARAKLDARWRDKSEKTKPNVPLERVQSLENLKKPRTLSKVKTKVSQTINIPTADAADNLAQISVLSPKAKVALNFALQPSTIYNDVSHENINGGNGTMEALQPKPAPVTATPNLPKVYQSEIKLLSDVEREQRGQIEMERTWRAKVKRTEKQKAARREKESLKARSKREQFLRDEAQNEGVTLSELDLSAQLDVYMAKRGADIKKRMDNRARKERIEGFAPDSLLLESLSQSQPCLAPGAPDSSDEDDDNPDVQARKANQLAMKESLAALKEARGGRFASIAAKKTVLDLESESDESEEDPDDDGFEASVLKIIQNGAENASGMSNDPSTANDVPVVTDDGESSISAALIPAASDMQIVEDLTSRLDNYSMQNMSQMPQSNEESSGSSNTMVGDLETTSQEQVRVYMVMRAECEDDIDTDPKYMSMFLDREEANSYAADAVQKYRDSPIKPDSVVEKYREGLFWGCVSQDEHKSTVIYCTSLIKNTHELSGFNPSKLKTILARTCYVIFSSHSIRDQNEETKEYAITQSCEPVPGMLFSDREIANKKAYDILLDRIKPENPNIDDMIEYANGWVPQIRETLKATDNTFDCFDVTLEAEEGHLRWTGYTALRVWVMKYVVQGPLN